MQKVLGFVFFLFVTSVLLGQSVPALLKRADRRFEAKRYREAIPYYDKVYRIHKENYYAGYRLAMCFKRTLQYQKAKELYLELSKVSDHDYEYRARYQYATLLKLESHFEEAEKHYLELVSKKDISSELLKLASKQREGCLLARRKQVVDTDVKVVLMEGLNSSDHDFGASLHPEEGYVLLATTRNLPGTQYEHHQYEGLLPDIAAFAYNSGRWKNITKATSIINLNTEWSEGSGCFSEDGKTLYFTSCPGDQSGHCQIMVTYRQENAWSEPQPLNKYINEPNSDNKHPSLSVTGDTLFFTSDRPGGYGGSDIWMSLRGGEGEIWTPAINMGEVINTTEDEISPHYASEKKVLFFSSNGHIGYGGFDIYAAKGVAFFEPELFNISAPYNSTIDDTYFYIADTVGYFSSNRNADRKLNLYQYPVKVEKKKYIEKLISDDFLIEGQLVTKFIDRGSLDLTTFRAGDYENYALFQPVGGRRNSLKDIFSREVVADSNTEDQGTTSTVGMDTAVAVPEGESVVYRSGLSFENLYFDYTSAQLRRETRRALKDFYESVKNESYTAINLLAFTDHLGTNQQNIRLSEARGKSVKAYLVALGIPAEKINVLARGELKPKKGQDHWFRRILNRRVEVHIDADEPLEMPIARALIIRKPMTLATVARLLDLPVTDVYQWNGEHENLLARGNTVRVYISPEKSLDPEYFITHQNISEIF